MTLADRIVVLQAGMIEQVGTPKELYDAPANLFVAQFIGSPKMNILPVQADGADIRIEGGKALPAKAKAAPAHVGIRPEAILPVAAGEGHIDGIIEIVEYLGADTFLVIDCKKLGQITVRTSGDADFKPGESIGLAFTESKLHYFEEGGQAV